MKGWSLLLLLAMLFSACAQVGEITGGPRDEAVPVLVEADPAPLSTRFTGDRIVLQFNERIQLDRPKDRMLVSPPLANPPTVRLSGARSVTITLNAPLNENTTYSFGIGEAVKDLTEGNYATGLVHVFTTGEVLDSLVVAGRVEDAFSGAPVKEALVLLYAVGDTGTVRTTRPAYATRSDANGAYALRYLREGKYRIHALLDRNANYRYDLPNEEIAFLELPVAAAPLDSNLTPHLLRMFAEVGQVQQLREAKVTPSGAFRLVFARAAKKASLNDVARTGGTLSWLPEWNPTRDTLLLWPSDTTALGAGRYAVVVDSMQLDTVRYRPIEAMPFFLQLETHVREDLGDGLVRIRASRPIATVDREHFSLMVDSLSIPFTLVQDSSDLRTWWLRSELSQGTSGTLLVMPKGVRDIYGGYNDTLRTGIGRASEQSTGTLRIRTSSTTVMDGPFILQLIDGQGIVVRHELRTELAGTTVWQKLRPGDHTLRLIQDANGNGRWDTGDLGNGLQPERVWRQGTPVNVRAAWDLGVDWALDP